MQKYEILTVEELNNSKPWIIRFWTFNHSYDEPDNPVMYNFVAVRWEIHDWCIYIGQEDESFERTASIWNKVRDIHTIQLLVECTPDALDLYRFS